MESIRFGPSRGICESEYCSNDDYRYLARLDLPNQKELNWDQIQASSDWPPNTIVQQTIPSRYGVYDDTQDQNSTEWKRAHGEGKRSNDEDRWSFGSAYPT
jgi:hypothetical protein